jgi:hypothetical protein
MSIDLSFYPYSQNECDWGAIAHHCNGIGITSLLYCMRSFSLHQFEVSSIAFKEVVELSMCIVDFYNLFHF